MALVFSSGTTTRIDTTFTANATLRSRSWWAYYTGAGGGSSGAIFNKGTNGSTYEELFYSSGSNYQFTVPTPPGTSGIWTWARPSDTAWHQFVLTYDSGAIANDPILYIDGVAQTTVIDSNPSGGTPNTSSNAYQIGNARGFSWNYGGRLAEFAIWDRILSADEAVGLGKGASPLLMPASIKLYVPMIRSGVIDWCNAPATVTGTTVQPHPFIILPGRTRSVPLASGVVSATAAFATAPATASAPAMTAVAGVTGTAAFATGTATATGRVMTGTGGGLAAFATSSATATGRALTAGSVSTAAFAAAAATAAGRVMTGTGGGLATLARGQATASASALTAGAVSVAAFATATASAAGRVMTASGSATAAFAPGVATATGRVLTTLYGGIATFARGQATATAPAMRAISGAVPGAAVVHWGELALGDLVPLVLPSLGVEGTTLVGRAVRWTYREVEGTLRVAFQEQRPATRASLVRLRDQPAPLPSVPVDSDFTRRLLATEVLSDSTADAVNKLVFNALSRPIPAAQLGSVVEALNNAGSGVNAGVITTGNLPAPQMQTNLPTAFNAGTGFTATAVTTGNLPAPQMQTNLPTAFNAGTGFSAANLTTGDVPVAALDNVLTALNNQAGTIDTDLLGNVLTALNAQAGSIDADLLGNAITPGEVLAALNAEAGTIDTDLLGNAMAAVNAQVGLASYTADPESSEYTGLATAEGDTPYAAVLDLNALRVAVENLRAAVEDIRTKLTS